jgi:hypothetical protein
MNLVYAFMRDFPVSATSRTKVAGLAVAIVLVGERVVEIVYRLPSSNGWFENRDSRQKFKSPQKVRLLT